MLRPRWPGLFADRDGNREPLAARIYRSPSLRQIPAVHRQHLPRGHRGGGACEKQDRGRDLLGSTSRPIGVSKNYVAPAIVPISFVRAASLRVFFSFIKGEARQGRAE